MSSKKYTRYPLEFRASSAKLAFESDQPISQTARELGVSPKSLYIPQSPNNLAIGS